MQTSAISSRHSDNPDIKAVILDYGLVLALCPKPDEFGRMAQVFRVVSSLLPLWETSRDLYDRGDLSAEAYWQSLAVKTGTSIDPGQIAFLRQFEVEIWSNTDPAMIDWVRHNVQQLQPERGCAQDAPDLAAVRIKCQ